MFVTVWAGLGAALRAKVIERIAAMSNVMSFFGTELAAALLCVVRNRM
jgi:hypothetical protein